MLICYTAKINFGERDREERVVSNNLELGTTDTQKEVEAYKISLLQQDFKH